MLTRWRLFLLHDAWFWCWRLHGYLFFSFTLAVIVVVIGHFQGSFFDRFLRFRRCPLAVSLQPNDDERNEVRVSSPVRRALLWAFVPQRVDQWPVDHFRRTKRDKELIQAHLLLAYFEQQGKAKIQRSTGKVVSFA